MKARIWIKQGRLDDVQDWVRRRGLSVDDEITYLREFDLITLARLLLTRRTKDDVEDAQHLLARLLAAAETGGRTGTVIEILILQAIASKSLAPLEQALTLAEPQGYVRLFVDEGTIMLDLLRQAAKQDSAPYYVNRLIAAFDEMHPQSTPFQPLIDPLSERELDVLRLLATDLSGPEIARKLIVSLSTMRTHTRSIYSKLDVNNRRSAVRRAEALNLL
jgi:LuxR family maltose regulon positive regulatory protein